MDQFQKSFEFSVQEVNQCTVQVADGTFRFFTKNEAKVDGKIPYSNFVSEHIKAVTDGRSIVHVKDGNKKSGKVNYKVYILCEHKERMAVSYIKSEHQMNHPLNFKFMLTCNECSKVEAVDVPSVDGVIDAPDALSVDAEFTGAIIEDILIPSIIIPNVQMQSEFKTKIEEIVQNLNGFIEKMVEECVESNDPYPTLIENKESFSLDIFETFKKAFAKESPLINEEIIIQEGDIVGNEIDDNNNIQEPVGLSTAEKVVTEVARKQLRSRKNLQFSPKAQEKLSAAKTAQGKRNKSNNPDAEKSSSKKKRKF